MSSREQNNTGEGREVVRLAWLIKYLYRQWHDDRISGLAAEIAFFALLSLFPMLLISSSALGWLGGLVGADVATDVQQQLTNWTGQVFGFSSGVTNAVSSLFDGSSTSALTVGIAATMYTASRGFSAVVRALDVAYGHENTRGWVGTQVIGFLLAVGTVIVMSITLAGLVIGPLFGREEFLGTGIVFEAGDWLWTWIRYPAAIAILVMWATTLYHLAPNRRAAWRWEVPGAMFAAALWLVATTLFSIYLKTLSTTSNAVYGVIGTAITIQLWLYLMSIGLILGAELNGALALRRGPASNWTEPELFTRAYRSLKTRLSRTSGASNG